MAKVMGTNQANPADLPPVIKRALMAIAAAIVALVLGLLVYNAIDHDAGPRAKAAEDLVVVKGVLDAYGALRVGRFPSLARCEEAVHAIARTKLPAGLPANRWGGPFLLVAPGAAGWPAGLANAKAVARRREALTPAGTDLGPGHLPGTGAPDALTYGAVVYDYDADNFNYVLYAIGRKGDRAVVVNAACNGAN